VLIAFDLDGTVLKQDMATLRMIDMVENRDEQHDLMRYYCNHLEMLFNPLDYLADGDTLFFITGRSIWVEEMTRQWAKKYFPTATVIVTRLDHPTKDTVLMTSNYGTDKSWNMLQSERKAKAINENAIDVYFEDNPEVVQNLRKMCPNTKVLQYGGRCF
jgi:hydroxymethylpyrimidine pyrophosphatase-like HAD family hydrolase